MIMGTLGSDERFFSRKLDIQLRKGWILDAVNLFQKSKLHITEILNKN